MLKGEEWVYCRAYDGTLFRFKFEDRVYDVVEVCPSGELLIISYVETLRTIRKYTVHLSKRI